MVSTAIGACCHLNEEVQYGQLPLLQGPGHLSISRPVYNSTMSTTEHSAPDIPRDDQGCYRSARLPSLRGDNVKLPSRLDESGQLEAWQRCIADPTSLITLDLFCGGGGMSLGFESAKFFVAAGIDHEPMAVATHGYNFLSKGIACDIRELEDPREMLTRLGLPRVDVIIGGPPCQGFARIGKGKLRSIDLEQHYDEVLNSLYKEFMRFVDVLQPLAFVMENVKGMANWQNGAALRAIEDALADPITYMGKTYQYVVQDKVLDAASFGAPQFRERIFLVGNRVGKEFVFPLPTVTEAE